jgi:hypothetical protein
MKNSIFKKIEYRREPEQFFAPTAFTMRSELFPNLLYSHTEKS